MKNLGLQFTGGKFYTMIFTPNSPLFHTSTLLVPMQEVSIKMYFNDPSVFMLIAAATDAAAIKAEVLSDDAIKITLSLCQVTVAPSLYRQITATRTRSTAMYPLHASKIRTFSMADGLTDFDQDQLFTNRVPVRVIVGLLHNSAFNGAYRRSPFAFEKFGLTLIRMTINGEEYPYKNALELIHNTMAPKTILGTEDFWNPWRRIKRKKLPWCYQKCGLRPSDWMMMQMPS